MLPIPKDLTNARIVITNDDGVDARGIAILESVARTFSEDVWVVAPRTQQSGVGHSISLHHPVRIMELEEKCFAINGTPTDSVLMAIKEIVPKDKSIDLVLSGINLGMNIADDVTYSGTISAAMESTLLDIPAIAFSQSSCGKGDVHWETAEHYALKVLEGLQGLPMKKGNLLSVNIPNVGIDDVKGIHSATLGSRKNIEKIEKRLDPKDRAYYWIGGVSFESEDGDDNSDIVLLRDNYVTITPLHMDMTDHRFMEKLSIHIDDNVSKETIS